MKRILMFILLLGAAQLAVAADLTGTWQCDDGGTYYLRQAGSELHWYGETATTAPRWSNVFDGRISGSRIKGRWYDVPKGQTQGQGELTLTIKDNGKVIEAARKSGGFGGCSPLSSMAGVAVSTSPAACTVTCSRSSS